MSPPFVFNILGADCRWQPAHHKVDHRYVGEQAVKGIDSKAGAWADETANGEEDNAAQEDAAPQPQVTIQQMRAKWGFPTSDVELK